MNREIKFRGQRKDNGQWVYGYLMIDQSGQCFIVNNYGSSYTWDEIMPETVGMWTGLTDKNEKEIYKGDLLKHTKPIDGNWIDNHYERYEVVYNNSIAGFEYKPLDGREYKQYTIRPFGGEEIEVIANIFDNPELNPAAGISGTHHMQDPREQGQTTETQPEVLPDAEEGNTEG